MMKGMRSAKQHDYEEDGRDDDDVNSDDEDDDFSMIMEQTDAKRMVMNRRTVRVMIMIMIGPKNFNHDNGNDDDN